MNIICLFKRHHWQVSNYLVQTLWISLHKKWSFPLRISSVNVTKSAVFCGKKSLIENFIFCSVFGLDVLIITFHKFWTHLNRKYNYLGQWKRNDLRLKLSKMLVKMLLSNTRRNYLIQMLLWFGKGYFYQRNLI